MAWIIPSAINSGSRKSVAGTQARADVAARTAEARAMSEARQFEAKMMNDARKYEAKQNRLTAVTQSNNQLSAERMENKTMRFGIMTNSRDFQFQILAWLTAQLEGLDTKAQIAMKDAEVRISQINSDERIERDKVRLDARELEIREAELNQSQQSQNNVSLGSFRV